MNILTEIVDLLSDEKNSLASALMKLKVLSSRVGNTELSNWIGKEIGGYKETENLPTYRIHPLIIKCKYMNGNWHVPNHELPITIFPEQFRNNLKNVKLCQDILSLESISNEKEIKFNISSSYLSFVNAYYQNQGNRYFSAYKIWGETSATGIRETLSSVRNYAFNLVLKLEETLGYEIEMQELIRKKDIVNQTINNIMNQTVITNKGDGNLINSGDNNSIENSVNITKSNFEQLREVLSKNGLQDSDIKELRSIIVDEPVLVNNRFGTKVNLWIQKMIAKALDGTWQISVGTAGTLLAESLMKYYGG